ncbi:MAG: UPF0182 family protein [Nocardioides sp.]
MSELFDDESARGPVRAEPQRPSGRSRALLITAVSIGVLLMGFTGFASIWTEKLWFSSLDYGSVFTRQLSVRILLFLAFAAAMALVVGINIWVAHRARPFVVPTSVQRDALDRYREVVSPIRGRLVIGVAVMIGLFSGSSAAAQWRTFLLWRNAEDFGAKDPYFNKDIGFYVFSLDWWHYLVDFAMAVVVVSLMASVLVHYLYGGIRLQSLHEKFSDAAQVHLSILVGCFVLLKAADYYLDRFDLLSADGGLVTGMTYTRDNAVLPARNILIGIALICALLFFLNVWRRTWLLPTMGLGMLVISSVLIGMIWPAIMQRFQVEPSAADKEADYVAGNIDATRRAYAIDDAVVEPYSGAPVLASEELAQAAISSPGIRLVDPQLVQQTFEQKQQVRGFYSVAPVLDVDRYVIDGKERDLVLGVRELDQGGLPDGSQNWNVLHTIYTHGYGVMAAYGNQRGADDGRQVTGSEPAWAERDIPPQGELTDLSPGGYEGRIYYGENSPSFSVVGKAKGSDGEDVELDLPGSGDGGSGDRTTTYDGKGGVPVGNPLNKLLYAVKFTDEKLLLSGRVHENSKILYDRSPRLMVEKVAPWLTVDEDPFPAIVDGRVVWLLDGYTTSNRFPLSQLGSYADMTRDSLASDTPQFQALPTDQINYLRNAVKATVDAYDGTVTLYAWDESDPILKAWMKAFPGTVKPKSAISEALLDHMRYPEDLFKVQRFMLASYHVTDADDFYKKNDQWDVAKDPNASGFYQPPYRLSVATPSGGSQPIFSLTSVYVPNKRQNLAAFVSVDADASLDTYGTMRVLRLSSSSTVNGPQQIAAQIGADEKVKRLLLPFTNTNATSRPGNLLTLPVGGGLLYVQPLYTQKTTGEGNYPVLSFVAVSFGQEEVGVGETLAEAIGDLLGVEIDDNGVAGEPDPETTPPDGPETDPGTGPDQEPTGTKAEQIRRLLIAADALFKEADAALQAGDLATYAEKVDQAQAKINRALEISRSKA